MRVAPTAREHTAGICRGRPGSVRTATEPVAGRARTSQRRHAGTISVMTTPGAIPIVLRPVAGSDEPALDRLLGQLSPEDRYRRFFSGATDVHRAAHEAAERLGLVAVSDEEVVGHGMLVPCAGGEGEVAFEVDPRWRHHGIASTLLAGLVEQGRGAGLRAITADVLCENPDMLAVFREHGGFTAEREGSVVHLHCDLDAPDPVTRGRPG